MTKVRTRSNSASASVPVSKQVKIQFQDDGTNIGIKGLVDLINLVGAGVTATISGNELTITIPGGGGGGAITNGQGTTANGTAVDLGGTVTAPVVIDLGAQTFEFIGGVGSVFRTTDGLTAVETVDLLVGVALQLGVLGNPTALTFSGSDATFSGTARAPTQSANDNSTKLATTAYADTKQPLDADLTAIAALASAADKLPYATGAQAWALTDLSSFMRTLLDDATAADARTTLGIGDDYFTLTIVNNVFNPADSTTYYFGGLGVNILAPTTVVGSHVFTSNDFAFTIIGAIIQAGLNSTAGTTELSTLKLRNETAATSSSIGTFQTDGSGTLNRIATINGLAIAVPASQSICLEWATPAWATNPVAVRLAVNLICKRS